MTQEENKSLIIQLWHVTHELRDYTKIAEFFTPDATYDDVPLPGTGAVGPQAIADRLRMGHEPVEAFEHEIHQMISEGDTVMTEHTETWCFHTGERVALPFVSVHLIEDGKIRSWRDYWDLQTLMSNVPEWWLEKLGVPADFSGGSS